MFAAPALNQIDRIPLWDAVYHRYVARLIGTRCAQGRRALLRHWQPALAAPLEPHIICAMEGLRAL
ncbi:hypothetical protein [Paenibacillus sp. OSY-SE]|uniref:hypothetical protein n=1 Tax=Paenibacillus sp. OSY-SE TaxID=1196323 RepID=UPI00030ACA2A|nr:hypothetical protein [Paenibacillus sp. OSY-SE]